MKTFFPLVTTVLVLLLMEATVQGIRLDAESHAAFSNQTFNKSGEKGVVQADGEPAGEMDRSILKRKSTPEIHEDYCGPRGHEPRHH